jgi:hypothetical protein
MARDFTKNTSNYMRVGVDKINPLISGASAVSIHAVAKPDTITATSGANRLVVSAVSNTQGGIVLSLHNGTSALVRVAARSGTGDAAQVAVGSSVVSTGSYASFGGVADFANDAVRVYYNGAEEANTAVTFANATYTPGTPTTLNDTIGADDTTSNQFDGAIAEVAIWNTDIGTSAFAMLADGVSALAVRPDALVFYMPLVGKYSPEIDVVSGQSGTITGTVAEIAHPRVMYPRRTKFRRFATASAGTTYYIPSDGYSRRFGVRES